jgi:hypothetical protein
MDRHLVLSNLFAPHELRAYLNSQYIDSRLEGLPTALAGGGRVDVLQADHLKRLELLDSRQGPEQIRHELRVVYKVVTKGVTKALQRCYGKGSSCPGERE